jgi:hypothetical protein
LCYHFMRFEAFGHNNSGADIGTTPSRTRGWPYSSRDLDFLVATFRGRVNRTDNGT